MTYQTTLVEGQFQNGTIKTSFPPTFSNLLLSVWFEMQPDLSGLQFGALEFNFFPRTAYSGFKLTVDPYNPLHPSEGLIRLEVGNGFNYDSDLYEMFGYVAWNSRFLRPDIVYHLLMSADTVTQNVKCYINDSPLSMIHGSPFWLANTPIASPNVAFPTSAVSTFLLAQNNFLFTNPCVGDAFMRASDTFFDISIASNRRKFINADLTPVDLGPNGEIPFGTPPIVYMHTPTPDNGGTAGNFLINKGFAGGSFDPGSDYLTICGLYPATPIINCDVNITGVEATAEIGIPTIKGILVMMDDLIVTQFVPPPTGDLLTLRYSDNGGRTWSDPRTQSLGAIGDYEKSMSFRNIGFGRNKLIEVSWSSAFKTALGGGTLLIQVSNHK